MMRPFTAILVIFFSLTSCTGGAVVFAPTPLPRSLMSVVYAHPSGAFSLILPGDWVVYEQRSTQFATASFGPSGADEPVVQVAVVDLGEFAATRPIGEWMTEYQTTFRPDLNQYTEQDRRAMSDGSWRITGLRTPSVGPTREINTFMQLDSTALTIIEVIVPQDAALRSAVQRIVNTYDVQSVENLPTASLAVLSSVAAEPLELVNVFAWGTSEGVFFITGEVANYSDDPLTDLMVRAVLRDANDEPLAEAVDNVMGYVLPSGAFAPFSLRFGQGRPAGATDYTLEITTNETPVPLGIVTAPTLRWTDETRLTQDGDLFVVGSIENAGDVTVRDPRAVVTIFNEEGHVIGAGFANAAQAVLAPSQSSDFTVLLSDLGGTAANYIVTVQAFRCEGSC